MITPQSSDWNHFWNKNPKNNAKISWSKRRIIKVLEPFLAGKKKALDAGCGSGFFSKYFSDQGLEVTSLDYSDRALEMTKKVTKGKAKIIKEDLISSNLNNLMSERFDIVFSDGLLEHFSPNNQDVIINNLKSVLLTNGIVITFVPNKFSPWEWIRPLFMPGIEETPFILSTLIRTHKRNGLKIIQMGGINTVPFVFSPDKIFGRYFGMLLYVIAKKDV